MPILSIEAVRENPWNVITHELPEDPDEVLLSLACLAAQYCRDSEYLLMHEAREGNYVPLGWQPFYPHPDVHEASEARSYEANRKFDELHAVYEQHYGERVDN